jgi:hypothetical protein
MNFNQPNNLLFINWDEKPVVAINEDAFTLSAAWKEWTPVDLKQVLKSNAAVVYDKKKFRDYFQRFFDETNAPTTAAHFHSLFQDESQTYHQLVIKFLLLDEAEQLKVTDVDLPSTASFAREEIAHPNVRADKPKNTHILSRVTIFARKIRKIIAYGLFYILCILSYCHWAFDK